MSMGSPIYARRTALRAVAAAAVLAVNAGAFVVLSSLAAIQYRELSTLRNELTGIHARSGGSRKRLADLERAIAERRIASFGDDGASRYRFASEVNARLLRSGLTVLNVFPARQAVVPSTQGGRGPAFRYEVSGTPSAFLAFFRSLRGDAVELTVNPLRLRVEADSLRGDLTVGYSGYESENP